MEVAPELVEITRQLYEASAKGDGAFVERLTSRQPGVLAIGTDPSEWWEGYDAISQAWAEQLRESGGLVIIEGNPQAYREGNVGWVADRAKFKLPGGEVPIRLTSVLVQEDGEWKIVQSHASIGVPNEETLNRALPL